METVKEKIENAYRHLVANDGYLFEKNVNERSITHKFAEYLLAEFPNYNIDCEYNKNLGDVKTMPVWETKRNELVAELERESTTEKRKEKIQKILDGEISVYPDIIVHHRGTKDNFIVIEAKKSTNTTGNDQEKLELYKRALNYQNAFFVTFLVGEDFENFNEDMIRDLIK